MRPTQALLRRFPRSDVAYVGVTGSCGKTTTTRLIGAVLSAAGECRTDAGHNVQSNKINFYDDQVFVKQPKTSERTYHQDSSYFHFEGDQACTMWIPVDPVSFKSGTIRYLRGSHRWGFFKPNVFVSHIFPGADGDTLPDIDGNEADYDIVS